MPMCISDGKLRNPAFFSCQPGRRCDILKKKGDEAMFIPEKGVLETSQRYFFTPSAQAMELLYYPTRAGWYFCDSRYTFSHRAETARLASHRLNLMLICVAKGTLEFRLESGHAIASPGQAALFDCRHPHEYDAGPEGVEFTWLLFNGLNAMELYERIIQSKGGRQVFAAGGFSGISGNIVQLVESCSAGERMSEPECSVLIHQILCTLLWNTGQQESEAVQAAVRFIRKNYRQGISVGEVAGTAGFSEAHFSRTFKAQTGYAPYEYVQLCRINEAKRLLLSTGLPVGEIAYRVGYGSEACFINAFRRKVGVPPGAYRRLPI